MICKDKHYRTRDGREVRIYAVDGGGKFSVHGAINSKGEWVCWTWQLNGRLWETSDSFEDLIEDKPRIRREVWVNVYRDPERQAGAFPRKSGADLCAGVDRIACVSVTIDCEEGEGL